MKLSFLYGVLPFCTPWHVPCQEVLHFFANPRLCPVRGGSYIREAHYTMSSCGIPSPYDVTQSALDKPQFRE